MDVFLEAIRHWAVGVGGSGLFLIALLDSSFLSFPQVADALVLVQSARHPHAMLYYAGMTTLGSVIGSLVLYTAGRKGGEVFLRRRFNASHVDRALRLYQRFGILTVLIPALLPPPVPLKIFVLLSGAAGVRPLAFGSAIAVGRGLRYFGQAWLAAVYGPRAVDLLARHASGAAGVLAVLACASALAYVMWRRWARQPSIEPFPPAPLEAD